MKDALALRGKEKVLKRWGQAVPEVLPGSHKAGP